jgi:hypothetical protein
MFTICSKRTTYSLVIVGWLTVVFLLSTATYGKETGQVARSDDPIRELNSTFRKVYVEARQNALDHSGPIVLVRGDRLFLLHNDQKLQGTMVHRAYHDYKTLAHVPLAIHVILTQAKTADISPGQSSQLEELRQKITATIQTIPARFRDPEQAERQTILLKDCVRYIDTVIASGQLDRSELSALLKRCLPTIQNNIAQSVKLRIDNYHHQMRAWRQSLSPKEWSQMVVLIPGAAMPRKNSLSVQYFAKLLHEPGESQRIVYAESLFRESDAMKLLGTSILDSQIGRDFFHDSRRMHRDVLGTAAANYLETLDLDKR